VLAAAVDRVRERARETPPPAPLYACAKCGANVEGTRVVLESYIGSSVAGRRIMCLTCAPAEWLKFEARTAPGATGTIA
jgi:DNA-directed RNA polymerase subunit RPC12/RpoP